VRFNKLLQEEISDIIQKRLNDPRIGFTSITRVEVTEDLRSAKIYFSVLEDSHSETTLQALQSASGLIRNELRHRIRARRIPELRFQEDKNIAYSVHMTKVLEQLRKEQKSDPSEE
jgi:ribosome-binding factor A